MTAKRLRELEMRLRANGALSQQECEELLRTVRTLLEQT